MDEMALHGDKTFFLSEDGTKFITNTKCWKRVLKVKNTEEMAEKLRVPACFDCENEGGV